ncbi:MAG TPA: hypothetical protein VGS58_12065 [Candidatus Sulfopaludibacter sp.]|nr:hypothetical protein [Candidatus Sulfopaludibacter sp.]
MQPSRRFALFAALYGFPLTLALHAQNSPSASSILADAEARAQAGHQAVFLIFHASW